MDSSKLYGLPLISTSQPPANAPSFTGIRAPLTLDDSDDDFYYSSSPTNQSSIDNSYISDTDSENPDPNDQTTENTIFVNQFDDIDGSVSSLSGLDVENVEYSEFRPAVPMALLSMDNGDDSEGSVSIAEEEDGFSDAVRIPSYGVLESIGSGPQVRAFAVESEDDSELESDIATEPDAVLAEGGEEEGFEFENAQEKQVPVSNGNATRLVSDHDKQHIAESTVSNLVPADIVENKDSDVEEIKLDFKADGEVKELEPTGFQLEDDIQSLYIDVEDMKPVNLDIQPKPCVDFQTDIEESKDSNFIGADDTNDLQVGETVGLVQNGNNEIQDCAVKQEIHQNVEAQYCNIKHNEACSSNGSENMHTFAAEDQLFPSSSSEGLAEGDELSRGSDISESTVANSLSELLMSDEGDSIASQSVEDEENSFSFSNDVKNSEVNEITDQSDYMFSRSLLDRESSQDCSEDMDGEVDTIEENKEKNESDTTALTALHKGNELGPTFRQPSGPVSQLNEQKSEGTLSEAERSKLEKIVQLRLKFLSIIQRLNQPPEGSISAQVFSRLALAQAFSMGSAQTEQVQFEADGSNDVNFSLNVLVIGKTGVGKSATVNSLFRQDKAVTDAFGPGTTTVKELVGVLDGVRVRVLDSPGLKTSISEQLYNRKALLSIKKAMTRCPPDVVLYVDRLDVQSRDFSDLALLNSITKYLGPSIWNKTIITLTHAASSPPDGPTGKPLSYEMFVAQRLRSIQQLINHSVGDMRITNAGLMKRISLVENHSSCRRNENGETLLPNGENWRSQLLLLCYSMKILSELNYVAKTRDPLYEDRSTLGLSMIKGKGDLKWCHKSCKVGVRAELDKKLSGQVSIRTNSLDYTQIAMIAALALAKTIIRM